MLLKYFGFLYVDKITNIQFHTYSSTKYFTNIDFINITALAELLVGVFHQHTGFSPTSFTNIKTARSPLLANFWGMSWTDLWKTHPTKFYIQSALFKFGV